MKLSTRAQYGTRALMDLALYGGAGPVPLKAIAQRQQISLTYLEHLVTPLIAAGIVRSVRGAKGGVALARLAREIRLDEVVKLLEGSTAPTECINDPNLCPRSARCATRDIWSEVEDAINSVLEAITLEDLAERQKSKGEPVEQMYYI